MTQLINLAHMIAAYSDFDVRPKQATIIFPSLTLAELFVSMASAIQGQHEITQRGKCVVILAHMRTSFPDVAHAALVQSLNP